jgi:hypothetical protein
MALMEGELKPKRWVGFCSASLDRYGTDKMGCRSALRMDSPSLSSCWYVQRPKGREICLPMMRPCYTRV